MVNKSYWAALSVILFFALRPLPVWLTASVDHLVFLKIHARWALAEAWIYAQDDSKSNEVDYPFVPGQDALLPNNLASFWQLAVQGDCVAAAATAAKISIDQRETVQFLIGNCWHQVGHSNEAAAVWRHIPHVDRYFLRQALACRDLDDLDCEDDYYQLAAAVLSHADWRATWQLLNHFRRPASAGIPQEMLANLRSLPDAPPEMIAYVEAEILFSQGQTAAAVQRYSQVIAAQPSLFRVYVDAGRAAQTYGDHELAHAYWRQGLLLAPERATFYRLIANSHYQQGDWEEAFAWYEQIPDDNQSITRRGDIRFNQERYAEAIPFYQQSLAIGHNRRVVERLARSYLTIGKPHQARETVALAIDEFADDQDKEALYFLLGDICEQMEDRDCAYNAYQQILALSPDNMAAQQRIQNLSDPD